MPIHKNTSNLNLLLGDIGLLSVSLYIALALRYWEFPSQELLATHFTAFSVLFLVWILIFFVAGLYDRQTLLFPEDLWQRILKTQAVNTIIAIVFFYTIPFFSITPKTNLFIYLVISFCLIAAWRYWASSLQGARNPTKAVLVAGDKAGRDVLQRIQEAGYGFTISSHVNPNQQNTTDLDSAVRDAALGSEASFIILDMQNEHVQEVLSGLYNLLYNNVHFISLNALYESVFERIPIIRLQPEWFIQHIRRTPHAAYDALKRGMDILISGVLFLLSLPLYPFIGLAIRLQDGGGVFYHQQRIGQFGKMINIIKFRTMTASDDADEKRVTGVGSFLRKTRLDELPQLLNVLEGSLSLIGPRPEIPKIATSYEKEIPYYNARHLIKPGLSGWAQLRHDDPPKFAAEIAKTQEKLSYDLYYVKNRSLLLDIKIALWTVRILASQSGK